MDEIAPQGKDSQAGPNAGNAAETRLFADILKQPGELVRSLSYTLGNGKTALDAAAAAVRGASSVIITGIGASWHAGMAMQAMLLAAGRPALLMDASELLHFAVAPRGSVVVILSRSGKSTEIVQLIDRCRAQAAIIVAITNQPDSPLALGADIVLHTRTDFDHAVSVTTYSAVALTGAVLASGVTGLAAQSMRDQLTQSLLDAQAAIPEWRNTIERSGWLGDGNGFTYFLARGAGLASCHEARLLWEEAAKKPATALTSGGFRHGPQEIVREGFQAGMWIDAELMRRQDLDLARDLRSLGARVLLIGQGLDESDGDCVLRLPFIPAPWQFLIEVIPIQIAAERLAAVRGEDPDTFRLCSYIVEDEGGISKPAASPASAEAL